MNSAKRTDDWAAKATERFSGFPVHGNGPHAAVLCSRIELSFFVGEASLLANRECGKNCARGKHVIADLRPVEDPKPLGWGK